MKFLIDTFADRGPLAGSIDLIRAGTWALDVLNAAGFNESDAANAIRDAMDQPWRRLTNGERQTLKAEARQGPSE